MYLANFLFVKKDFASDSKRIDRVFGPICEERLPVWVVAYLEGTRFTKEKHREVKAMTTFEG